MSTKTTGLEFKAFLCDLEYWPLETDAKYIWHDCERLTINGLENDDWNEDYLQDTDKIGISEARNAL